MRAEDRSAWSSSVLIAVMVALGAWSAREIVRQDGGLALMETRVLALHVKATESAQGIESINAKIAALILTLQDQMKLMNTVSNERLNGLDARLQEEIRLNARITVEAKIGFEKRISLLETEIRRPK